MRLLQPIAVLAAVAAAAAAHAAPPNLPMDAERMEVQGAQIQPAVSGDELAFVSDAWPLEATERVLGTVYGVQVTYRGHAPYVRAGGIESVILDLTNTGPTFEARVAMHWVEASQAGSHLEDLQNAVASHGCRWELPTGVTTPLGATGCFDWTPPRADDYVLRVSIYEGDTDYGDSKGSLLTVRALDPGIRTVHYLDRSGLLQQIDTDGWQADLAEQPYNADNVIAYLGVPQPAGDTDNPVHLATSSGSIFVRTLVATGGTSSSAKASGIVALPRLSAAAGARVHQEFMKDGSPDWDVVLDINASELEVVVPSAPGVHEMEPAVDSTFVAYTRRHDIGGPGTVVVEEYDDAGLRGVVGEFPGRFPDVSAGELVYENRVIYHWDKPLPNVTECARLRRPRLDPTGRLVLYRGEDCGGPDQLFITELGCPEEGTWRIDDIPGEHADSDHPWYDISQLEPGYWSFAYSRYFGDDRASSDIVRGRFDAGALTCTE